jgi:hypothetical protein
LILNDYGSGHLLRQCSNCKLEKAGHEFYKKGLRIESRCKECIKKRRVNDYTKKRKSATAPAKRRITEVVIKGVQNMSPDQHKREMETVELILENLIYRVLSKKLPRGQNE